MSLSVMYEASTAYARKVYSTMPSVERYTRGPAIMVGEGWLHDINPNAHTPL